MPSYVPAKNGSAFIFYVSLVDQSNTKLFKSSPTLAAGDVKVSIDGGALADLATLPTVTPAAGRRVKVSLSGAEMTGDNIGVLFSDASGAEWCDLFVNIQTSARQIDDLASQASVNTVDDFLDTEIADIQARLPAALVSGRIDASIGAAAANTLTASALATDAVTEIQSGLATAASIAALNNLSAAQVNAEADTALADAGVTTTVTGRIDAAISTRASQTSVDDLPTNAELATSQAAADDVTLAAIAALNNLSAAQVNAEVDTALSDYDAPTHAELTAELATADDATLAAIAGVSVPTVAAIRTEIDSNSTQLAAILDDTGNTGVVVAAASKSGYALSSTGLDSVAITAPSGVASNFREMLVQVWRRHFKKSTLTATELKTYADNGSTVLTTQTVSDDNTTQTMESAT